MKQIIPSSAFLRSTYYTTADLPPYHNNYYHSSIGHMALDSRMLSPTDMVAVAGSLGPPELILLDEEE